MNAFIFDLDGTILFLGTNWERVKIRLKKLYSSYNLEVKHRGIFKSIFEARDLAFSKGISEKVLNEAFAILDDEEIKGAENSKIREGSLEMLEYLKGSNIAIVSSNCRKAALIALKAVGLDEKIFSKMVMRDDVKNLKPSPEPVCKAIDFLIEKNPSINNITYIGDQKNDILAVRAAAEQYNSKRMSIKTIAVSGGATYEDKLRRTNPDYFTNDLKEVLATIKNRIFRRRSSKFDSASCIVIAYNEEATIREAIEEVYEELNKYGFKNLKIIVVDDASTDKTGQIAREVASKNPAVKIITHEKNRGPGSGIKTGIENADGEVICFHAADRQLDFSEVASYIPLLDRFDLLIGERRDRPGYTTARKIVSKLGIWVSKLFFGLKYKDYYFLYLYRRSVFENMKLRSDGIYVVVEILAKALGRGLKVGEVSAGCYPRKHGKATCGKPSVIFKTFREAIGFWFFYKVLGRDK